MLAHSENAANKLNTIFQIEEKFGKLIYLNSPQSPSGTTLPDIQVVRKHS